MAIELDLLVSLSDVITNPDLTVKPAELQLLILSQLLDGVDPSGTEISTGRKLELCEGRRIVEVGGLDEGGIPVLEIGERVAKVLVRLSCLETRTFKN